MYNFYLYFSIFSPLEKPKNIDSPEDLIDGGASSNRMKILGQVTEMGWGQKKAQACYPDAAV